MVDFVPTKLKIFFRSVQFWSEICSFYSAKRRFDRLNDLRCLSLSKALKFRVK